MIQVNLSGSDSEAMDHDPRNKTAQRSFVLRNLQQAEECRTGVGRSTPRNRLSIRPIAHRPFVLNRLVGNRRLRFFRTIAETI